MEAAERLEGEENLYREEKYAAKYEINMLRCIFCGLCEEACPKDAIYLSETFTPADFARKNFIYTKQDLLIPNPVTQAEDFAAAKGVKN
jgi:NADH-quinone oxidoreductase subunit I